MCSTSRYATTSDSNAIVSLAPAFGGLPSMRFYPVRTRSSTGQSAALRTRRL